MKTVRTLMAVLIALMMIIGAFVAVTGDHSDAQEEAPRSCPDGFELADDGTTCVSTPDGDGVNDNVTTTTSCLQGVLSDDGQYCIVPRLDADSTGAAVADDTAAPVPAFTG